MSILNVNELLDLNGASLLVKPGSAVPFLGSVLPSGWLWADGSTKNVADYPNLFAAIGNQFGGDGVTTFDLPHLNLIKTQPKLFTPTLSYTSNVSASRGYRWRDGKFLCGSVKVRFSGAPSPTGNFVFTIPDSLVMDDPMLGDMADGEVGEARLYDTGTTALFGVVEIASTTTLLVRSQRTATGTNPVDVSANTIVTHTSPFVVANGDQFQFNFRVPIVGWDSGSIIKF